MKPLCESGRLCFQSASWGPFDPPRDQLLVGKRKSFTAGNPEPLNAQNLGAGLADPVGYSQSLERWELIVLGLEARGLGF